MSQESLKCKKDFYCKKYFNLILNMNRVIPNLTENLV